MRESNEIRVLLTYCGFAKIVGVQIRRVRRPSDGYLLQFTDIAFSVGLDSSLQIRAEKEKDAMEKMFVSPENLEANVMNGTIPQDPEQVHSRGGIVSYRCKVYRAMLEQGRPIRPNMTSSMNNDEAIRRSR